jgi:sec-independent protein translocase protein TatA
VIAMTSAHVIPLVFDLGAPELLIILAVIVLLFGASKLPELARGSGRALRIFKAETKGLLTDDQTAPPAQAVAPLQIPAPAPVYAPPIQQAAPAAPVYAAPVPQAPVAAPVYAAPVQQAPVAPAPAEQPVPEHRDAQ